MRLLTLRAGKGRGSFEKKIWYKIRKIQVGSENNLISTKCRNTLGPSGDFGKEA